MEFFYSDSVSKCPLCEGSGYRGAAICSCLIRHRANVWLKSGGFSSAILSFVAHADYRIPMLDSGDNALNFYLRNPELVLERGLSLYLFSREAGRGKTTLAYYIMWYLATYFLHTDNYRPGLKFAFQNANSVIDSELSFVADDNPAWTSTFYVLDDLGNEERASKYKKEAVVPILQKVLHHRQDSNLPTIITSNYHPKNLGELYANRLDSLLELDLGGEVKGNIFRQIEVGGGEDLRTSPVNSVWPSDI